MAPAYRQLQPAPQFKEVVEARLASDRYLGSAGRAGPGTPLDALGNRAPRQSGGGGVVFRLAPDTSIRAGLPRSGGQVRPKKTAPGSELPGAALFSYLLKARYSFEAISAVITTQNQAIVRAVIIL